MQIRYTYTSARPTLAILLLIFLFSCEETLPNVNSPQSYAGATYGDLFEAFWNGMNTNYVFWDIDPTDWDAAYKKYQPAFAGMGGVTTANDSIAQVLFTEMTSTLVDSHYELTFERTGKSVQVAENRKLAIDIQYPDSIYQLPSDFFTSVVRDNYIDPATMIYGADTLVNNPVLTGLTGRLAADKSILYLHFNYFLLSKAGKNVQPVINYFFNTVATLGSGLDGIVIDLRRNGGGYTSEIEQVVGALTTSTFEYGSTHSKSGLGRLDYSPWVPAIIRPATQAFDFKKPVVVLADHFSISAAEATTLAIQALPNGNGKIIGTTTWGANGPLIASVYANGGQFTIGQPTFGSSGYLFVYTSSYGFRALNGKSYEGRGIPPDKWVVETSSAISNGVDLQLERAINYIHGN